MANKNALLARRCVIDVEASEAISHLLPIDVGNDLDVVALVAILHFSVKSLVVILGVPDP